MLDRGVDTNVLGRKLDSSALHACRRARGSPIVTVREASLVLESGKGQSCGRNLGERRHRQVDVEGSSGLLAVKLNREPADQRVRGASRLEHRNDLPQRSLFRITRQ